MTLFCFAATFEVFLLLGGNWFQLSFAKNIGFHAVFVFIFGAESEIVAKFLFNVKKNYIYLHLVSR